MEQLRHEVPTHIETPDTMAGIAMQKWFYLFFGMGAVFMLFIVLSIGFDTTLTTILITCAASMVPVLIIFLLPLGDDRIEQRLWYRVRFWAAVPKICVWRTDDWRWQQLLVEKTGRRPTSEVVKNTRAVEQESRTTEEI